MCHLFEVLRPYTLFHSHPHTGLVVHKLFFPHCCKCLCVHCNFLERGRSACRAWKGQSEEGRMMLAPAAMPRAQHLCTWEPAAGERAMGTCLSLLLSPETLLETVQATCPGDSSCQSATLAELLCFSAFLSGPCTEGG